MANLSRPSPARQILSREPARQARLPLRLMVIGIVAVLALAALAWIDGGEEPLHPIAEAVTLPEVAQ